MVMVMMIRASDNPNAFVYLKTETYCRERKRGQHFVVGIMVLLCLARIIFLSKPRQGRGDSRRRRRRRRRSTVWRCWKARSDKDGYEAPGRHEKALISTTWLLFLLRSLLTSPLVSSSPSCCCCRSALLWLVPAAAATKNLGHTNRERERERERDPESRRTKHKR